MELFSQAENEQEIEIVETYAQKLGLVIKNENPDFKQDKLMLYYDTDGLSLRGYGLEVRGDFTQMLPRLKLNNLRGELLVRAAKIKDIEYTPTLIDATAGLGEDSLLLAASGFSVKLYERDPIIAILLEDALRRAFMIPELTEIVSRMQLFATDSIEALGHLQNSPDVILLDPMFPARQKSGLVKKKFQLLQHLEQPCAEEEDLVQAALAAHPHKIVIKRPSKGPFLAGIKPSYSIEGKGIRYDCLMQV